MASVAAVLPTALMIIVSTVEPPTHAFGTKPFILCREALLLYVECTIMVCPLYKIKSVHQQRFHSIRIKIHNKYFVVDFSEQYSKQADDSLKLYIHIYICLHP